MVEKFQTTGLREFIILQKSKKEDMENSFGILYDKEGVYSFDLKNRRKYLITRDFVQKVFVSKDKQYIYVNCSYKCTIYHNKNPKNFTNWISLHSHSNKIVINEINMSDFYMLHDSLPIIIKSVKIKDFTQEYLPDKQKKFSKSFLFKDKLFLFNDNNDSTMVVVSQEKNKKLIKFDKHIGKDEIVIHISSKFIVSSDPNGQILFRDHGFNEKFVLKTNIGVKYELKLIGSKEMILWSKESSSIYFLSFPHIKIFSDFKHPYGNVKEILMCKRNSESWITSVSEEGNIIEIKDDFKTFEIIYLTDKDTEKKERNILDIVYDSKTDRYYFLNTLEHIFYYDRILKKSNVITKNINGQSTSFLVLHGKDVTMIRPNTASLTFSKETKKLINENYNLQVIDQFHSIQKKFCGENDSYLLYQGKDVTNFPNNCSIKGKILHFKNNIK
jgi:hypothetical protein